MRKTLIAIMLASAALPGAALAQSGSGAAAGAAGGAVTGAVVGGPVGAVVGGVAGAAIGGAIDPPPAQVREYVMHENVPSVAVQQEVTVGAALPSTVKVYSIPQTTEYQYAVVNERRVIVEPKTRKIVQIVE